MVEYAREAVRNALMDRYNATKNLNYTVVAKTEDGLVIVDEQGQAYEVSVRAL